MAGVLQSQTPVASHKRQESLHLWQLPSTKISYLLCQAEVNPINLFQNSCAVFLISLEIALNILSRFEHFLHELWKELDQEKDDLSSTTKFFWQGAAKHSWIARCDTLTNFYLACFQKSSQKLLKENKAVTMVNSKLLSTSNQASPSPSLARDEIIATFQKTLLGCCPSGWHKDQILYFTRSLRTETNFR